jgi:hypothetical protein
MLRTGRRHRYAHPPCLPERRPPSRSGRTYTKAYVSALENGLAKPSMAALSYLTERLGTTPAALLANRSQAWHRLEADIHLAAGDWAPALDGYLALLDGAPDRTTRAEILLGTAEALCRLDRPADAIAPATEAAAAFETLGRAEDRTRAEYWLVTRNQVDNPDERGDPGDARSDPGRARGRPGLPGARPHRARDGRSPPGRGVRRSRLPRGGARADQ